MQQNPFTWHQSEIIHELSRIVEATQITIMNVVDGIAEQRYRRYAHGSRLDRGDTASSLRRRERYHSHDWTGKSDHYNPELVVPSANTSIDPNVSLSIRSSLSQILAATCRSTGNRFIVRAPYNQWRSLWQNDPPSESCPG
jgi:hypothetical protein